MVSDSYRTLIVATFLVLVSCASIFRNQNILMEYTPGREQLIEENNLHNSIRDKKLIGSHTEKSSTLTKTQMKFDSAMSHDSMENKTREQLIEENNLRNSTRVEKLIESHTEKNSTLTKTQMKFDSATSHDAMENKTREQLIEENNLSNSTRDEKLIESHTEKNSTLTKTQMKFDSATSHDAMENKTREQLIEENNLGNSTRDEKLIESHTEKNSTLTKTQVNKTSIENHAEKTESLQNTTKEVGQYKYPELGTDFVDDYIDHCADESCMKAFGNISTVARIGGNFYAGFRNQIMAFTAMVFDCKINDHGQIMLETIRQKDMYGTNKNIPFEKLWDVGYWNSFYPLLPRLVRYDPVIHDQWDVANHNYYWFRGSGFTDAHNSTWSNEPTRPYLAGKQHHLFDAYVRYTKGKGRFSTGLDGHRDPTEILMLRGAMRPHPKLRKLIDGFLASLQNGTDATEPVEYMTLHARVEPDMQKHPVCKDSKVLNLTDIFDWMEEKWPDPPVKRIFMPINRKLLEKEGSEDVIKNLQAQNRTDKINWIAVNNLRALNEARDKGLWNGRAKVFEFGANGLKDTEFEKFPSTTGSLVDFFIAIRGSIFIGTRVSSFSHDILNTRFFRNYTDNYEYLPDGLHDWTPPGTIDPPQFSC